MKISRRTLLRRTALGAFTLGGSMLLAACGLPGSSLMGGKPPRSASPDFVPDLEIELTAKERSVQLLPGPETTVWSYEGKVLKGDATSLEALPGSYLGPIIRASSGQKVRVHFRNELPDKGQTSIIHWHGLRLPADVDGHPHDAIAPGQTYVYEFTVKDRAGTYWYHPHPDMHTGRQVYQGMAGLFIVADGEEAAAKLPTGAQDISLVIQDRTFDKDNRLIYAAGEPMGGSMDYLMGFLGKRVLVNGTPDYELHVATRAYRLRLLNGSNTRIYKLAWDDGTPLTVIGSDGGLLERPVERPFITLAPGERVELWADWSKRAVGDQLTLQSLAFSGAEGAAEAAGAGHGDHGTGGHGGHGGSEQPAGGHADHGGGEQPAGGHAGHDMGTMASAMSDAPAIGAPMTIMKVVVTDQATAQDTLTTVLSAPGFLRREDAVNSAQPRPFVLTQPAMRWEINGRSYKMGATEADTTVKLNDLEVWEIINATNEGETMHPQGMVHPFHIHGTRFQVIERQVAPELASGVASVAEGYLDEGWKDTVLLMPGERVKILVKFTDFTGTYMYHCHILEHEDMGMMGSVAVVG